MADTTAECIAARLQDHRFQDLIKRIRVEVDESFSAETPFSARLSLRCSDRRPYDGRMDDARGRGHNQFTQQEIEAKFRQLAAAELDPPRMREVIAVISRLETIEDMRQLTVLLVRGESGRTYA